MCFYMKKWSILVLIFISISLAFLLKGKVSSKEKYDFHFTDRELGITFYKESGNEGLLLQNNQNSYLFLWEVRNKERFDHFLNTYQNHSLKEVWKEEGIDYLKGKTFSDYYDSTIRVTMNPYLKITYFDQSLCIIEKEESFDDCDYLYIRTSHLDLNIPDDVKLIVKNPEPSQDSNLLYRTLELKEDYLITLKIGNNNFDTITLPYRSD